MGQGYVSRIAGICRSLGIPPDYAVARGLPLQPEADERQLILLGINAEGREVVLEPSAGQAWRAMATTAAADKVELLPLSGFRSVARQTEIIREKLAVGRPLDDILRWVAAPGHSVHHTGRAVDIGAPDEPPLAEGFADTAAFAWLTRRAGEFGFRLSYPRENPKGIAFEPWHWCWHR